MKTDVSVHDPWNLILIAITVLVIVFIANAPMVARAWGHSRRMLQAFWLEEPQGTD